jgi:hypothetical protein
MVRRSVVVVALLAAPLLAGCSGGDPAPAKSAAPTPIARLDVAAVRLARVSFCDNVPGSAVRDALGGKAQDHDSWGNGDPVPGGTGAGDVGHELGCSWSTEPGTAARAWVFARPVTADLAGTLVAQAGHQPGCTATPADVLGTPALLQTCTLPGGVQRVRRAGLFGDTWLTCELAGPAATQPRARLDAWCATVVAALDVA